MNSRYCELVKIQCMEILSILLDSQNPEIGIFLSDCISYSSKLSRLSSVPVPSSLDRLEGGETGVLGLFGNAAAQLPVGPRSLHFQCDAPFHFQESSAHDALRRVDRRALHDSRAVLPHVHHLDGIPRFGHYGSSDSERVLLALPAHRDGDPQLREPLLRHALFGVGGNCFSVSPPDPALRGPQVLQEEPVHGESRQRNARDGEGGEGGGIRVQSERVLAREHSEDPPDQDEHQWL